MKSTIKTLFVLFFIVFSFQINAQEKIIHGMIHCFDSIPLVGAQIKVKSTKQAVLSDSIGHFTVTVNSSDKLKVSASGFFTEKVNVTKQTKIVAVNLKMKAGVKNREYAIGYANISDKEKMTAVSSINKDDFDFSMYSDIYEVIRGRFAGVQVQSNGDIIIRGVNSFNSSSAALIVIDGISSNAGTLSSIPTSQVKNISVLKDGGAAIYGTRGANGVVLIETKKGGD